MDARVVALCLSALAACHRELRPIAVRGAPNVDDIRNDGIGMYFDCDAPARSYAEWSQPVGSTGRAQGAVFIADVRRDADQVTAAHVMLFAHGRSGHAGISVVLGKRWRTLEPTVKYAASKDERSQRLQPREIRGVTFEIEWNGPHARLRLESNAPWLNIDLAFVPERFALQCSAGESVFHSVSVTSQAPEPQPTSSNAAQ